MTDDLVQSKNVSMYENDWRIVEMLALRLGIATSAALRIIVRDWDVLRLTRADDVRL